MDETLQAELQAKLKELADTFGVKVNQTRKTMEQTLTAELIRQISNIMSAHSLPFSKENIEKSILATAEMFVNNTITEGSIHDDPSGDWDGFVRESELDVTQYLIHFANEEDE